MPELRLVVGVCISGLSAYSQVKFKFLGWDLNIPIIAENQITVKAKKELIQKVHLILSHKRFLI